MRVVNVLAGEAAHVRQTPFGDMGTVFSSPDLNAACADALPRLLLARNTGQQAVFVAAYPARAG